MNKQKNPKKNESTSVLERIRRRTGLLVGIVGLALVIFILQSLLGSGPTIFGDDEYTTIGYINGKKIDRNEFNMSLENRMAQYRQNSREDVGDQLRAQVIDNLIQQYVLEHAMKPEFRKAGLSISENELYEKVVLDPDQTVIQNLTDPNTGKVNEQFSRPDGTLDLMKWKQAVQNVTGESEMAVRQMEEMVETSLYYQKFRALVNKGMYVTKAETEQFGVLRNTHYDFEYVFKSFASVDDNSIKMTESDMEKYYKEHAYLYQNPENGRKIEYVVFNVMPTEEDLKAIEEDARRVAEAFRAIGKDNGEDSLLMAQESENGNIVIENFTRKDMIVRDSSIFTSSPGTVFGPYNEGAYFKIYKLQDINYVADSARVRHILIGTQDPQTQEMKRTPQEARRMADSLLVLLKENKADFNRLVTEVSDDMGSKMNGGDYGWFDDKTGFVEPFKNAGLMGKKGEISVVPTEYGFHIIEVLEVSKGRYTSYRVAQIFKPIVASDETNQEVFAKASRFAGENNTAEKFDQATEKQGLTRRMADDVREGDYQLPGLEGAKEIVKWAYKAPKGDVEIFTVPGKHVVAKLSSIKEKGTLPLKEVKADVEIRTRTYLKGKMLIGQMAEAGNDLKAAAEKLGVQVLKQVDFVPETGAINEVGIDQSMSGTVLGTAKGTTSKPRAGQEGAYMLAVNDIENINSDIKIEDLRGELQQQIKGRSDFEAFNAIKEQADIDIHKTRID